MYAYTINTCAAARSESDRPEPFRVFGTFLRKELPDDKTGVYQCVCERERSMMWGRERAEERKTERVCECVAHRPVPFRDLGMFLRMELRDDQRDMCQCVHVCVCTRERERERERVCNALPSLLRGSGTSLRKELRGKKNV